MTNKADQPTNETRVVFVAAGGTGGHIYPGLAVARELRARGYDVRIVGTPKGLESNLVPAAGYPLVLLPTVALERSLGAVFRLPIATLRAVAQARSLLRHSHAAAVVGMGGYASVPIMIAARLTRTPALVHESGAVAGRANKLCARLAGRAALSFDVVRNDLAHKLDTRTTGMPLWQTFDQQASPNRPHEPFVVLATGGSQGSMVINQLAIALAKRWRSDPSFRIVLKTGTKHRGTVDALVAPDPVDNLELVDYFESIGDAYAMADVVVTRAGAGTIAELETVGIPAVLLPYPYAPDDHQARNAEVLTNRDAAIMVRDTQATPESVAPWIERLAADDLAYKSACAAALNDVHQHAAAAVADWVDQLTS
jgi:UDP-N-acetylglucosamine--N-acetylmuramyl-(pentapeptide) pyrophosphoryl-undecaprenol N-acetylglucosamine transferase